ncbi:MAG: 4Fe-4S dicluster domain-containing protein [Myxococcota bacterium]
MGSLPDRLKLLRHVEPFGNRIISIRRFTILLTLVLLYAVPYTGLARTDLWGGRHAMLFRPVHWVMGVGAVGAGIFAFYILTFAVNWGFGRIFCGFGCPVGYAARFGDAVQIAKQTRENVAWVLTKASVFALLFSGAILTWWVDPRVLLHGGPGAVIATASAWFVLALAIVAHGHFWRWDFCKGWCPIGLYYTAVQLPHRFGVQYQNDANHCDTCNLCVTSCPVGLDPRALGTRLYDRGPIALDGFPGTNHCLTCGDCVRACDFNHHKKHDTVPPLSLSLRPDAPRVNPAQGKLQNSE